MPRMAKNDNTDDRLEPMRKRIDELDAQLVKMLNERAEVVVNIGQVKRDEQSPIYAPDREQRVLEQIRRFNAGPLPDSCFEAIWRELMSGSFALERPPRIGYLGPPGSFSHIAAKRKFGSSVEYDAVDDIRGVFDEVARGHIELGVVPIENSTEGGVQETLDAFLECETKVYAELLINIHHNLLANCPPDSIKRVYSKPEILNQCRKWLSLQLHDAERIPVASSSKAAEMAAREPDAAAIGSSLAAEMYGLVTQYANIEDNPSNVTRFFVIANESAKATGDDKTAFMFTTAHQPGALANVLDTFRDHGMNLTHIDKRPSRRVNWEYYFFVDCVGHQDDPKIREAIEIARAACLHLSILGSFPRAKEVL